MSTTVQTRDEAQIRELMADWVAAIRAKDAERLVSRYAPEIVQYNLAPPLRNTGAEVLDPSVMRNWFATFDGPMDYEIRDLDVTVGGDVAFCHSLNCLSAKPHGAPEGFDGVELWMRATVCLRKIEDAWLITHEHTSTPFHMDGSFKAATDLKP